ncbi:hypothetical protein [Rhodovulum strictum]|uniref:Uncharacterized protein n=1 Tax=Rhodovulum strictum TaxID=58314 RepID=A0A844BAX5_9RHOB|nr:hypothetical protein [Rhodovulum strictum]MRH19819.1 hypothetical protein [Rhodovulum strictum]
MRTLPCLALVALLFPLAAGAAEVTLSRADLAEIAPGLWSAPGLVLPDEDRTLPIVGDQNTEDGTRLLRHLAGRGGINGFAGLLYDNRDRGHAPLRPDLFPRLTRLVYAPDLVEAGLDYGLAGQIHLPAVVLGNSSTAVTAGPAPRSLVRLAMTRPMGPHLAAELYQRNAVYIYPEHRDHDAADLFPANWPYTITSQGSSGSDRRFLIAVAMTLAAFPADTMAALRDRGLVAPTVQMILRRNLAPVATREDYLSGRTHPAAFEPGQIRIGRMVAQAAALPADEIPPMVRLRVIDESFRQAAGLAGLDERLFDTTSAIARIWRDFDWQREMIVSADETADPNGRPLRFEWRLLAGDPGRVRIEPLDPAGRRARIVIDWHAPWTLPAPGGGEEYDSRRHARVDIGVFAHNGAQDSAPGFVSIAFPAHERRSYGPAGPEDTPRLVSIDYDAAGRGADFDPILHWTAPWSDEARHDDDGRLLGWTRRWADGRERFVPFADLRPAGGARYRIDRTNPRQPLLRFDE